LGIIAVAGALPASAARVGGAHASGHIGSVHVPMHSAQTPIAGRFAARRRMLAGREFRLGHHRTFERDFSGALWPYRPYSDGLPSDDYSTDTEAPAAPEVLVNPWASNPVPKAGGPEPPQDFSYVPGCHAIPNGYHCDGQHQQEPH
jgi:hypothetical protein